jgi:predicted RNase H-like HicB family nuclease
MNRIVPRDHKNEELSMTDAVNPYNRIVVELNLGDYLVTATSLNGWDSEQWWRDLGDLLYGRAGWHCEIVNTSQGVEMVWSFGAMGSALFIISFGEAPAYHLYDHEADDDLMFEDVEALRAWLDDNEQRHLEYPRRLRNYAADADWAMLKSFPFSVDVTYDGAAWIATFRELPLTYSSGQSLAEVISNAREAITEAFDAPIAAALDLQVAVRLDAAASAAL